MEFLKKPNVVHCALPLEMESHVGLRQIFKFQVVFKSVFLFILHK